MPACEISPETLEDLQRISDFIAADDPNAAARVTEEFFSAFDQLASWPRSGHLRPYLTDRDVRFWPVHAILHASRDIPLILGDR